MSQHADLDEARWSRFDLDQQLLMIGNEMNRTTRFAARGDADAVRRGYERVLRLTDLTVACRPRPALRRELLRWREVVAGMYASVAPDPVAHRLAFRVLLQLRPATAKQIPLLVPRDRSG
jgi:hypothetical protein